MTQERPLDWHPQDWAIVIEALAHWAGSPKDADYPREERAWELIESIGVTQGVTPDELVLQIDDDWRGMN